MLGALDPLPLVPRRVVVAGTSGSGKTTLAGRIAETLSAPHQELDGLYHGPGWVRRQSFVADVTAIAERPLWVSEWQYDEGRPILLRRADVMVWMDLPRRVGIRRVVWRTVQRRFNGTALWNGNREAPLHTFFTDRDHVVRWAWRTHQQCAGRVAEAVRERGDLVVVRLRSQRDVDLWVAGPLATAAHGRPAVD